MQGNLVDAMGRLRSLLGLYFTTLGLLMLALLVGLFKIAREAEPASLDELWAAVRGARESIEILGFVVYRESFSLLYGLVFVVFLLVLAARVRNLRLIWEHLRQSVSAEERMQAAATLRLFPWAASPFHARRAGAVFFWTGIGGGVAFLGWVIYSHLFLCVGNIPYPELWYRAIGGVDLVLLVIALPFLRRLWDDILCIRRDLKS